MTDPRPRLLYRSIKGSRAEGREPVVCALRLEPIEPIAVESERLSWSPRCAALLREILAVGRASGDDRGRALPYASLRAALAASLPEALVLDRNLGAPWSENPRPFVDLPLGSGDSVERLAQALRLWIALVLRPWAHGLGVSEALVDALDALGSDAVTINRRAGELTDLVTGNWPFSDKRDAILQRAAAALEGANLFSDLGPVYRIVRAHGASNAFELITWPMEVRDSLQSMVAQLSVETLPFEPDPIVTVRAGRRRWLPFLPSGSALYGQRGITLTLMARDGAPIATEVVAPIRGGAIIDPVAPAFLAQLLRTGADMAVPLEELVAAGASGPGFAGVVYSPQMGGSHPLGSGVSTRDQLDLFDSVRGELEKDGFVPLPFEETPSLRRAPKRPEEQHKALEAEALLSDIAVTIGRNDLDDDASIEAAWKTLNIDGDAPGVSAAAARRAGAKLAELRLANIGRVAKAFGDRRPRIVILGRTEDERRVLKSILAALFGSSLKLEDRPLPNDVHGPSATLPLAGKKAKQRFEARVTAWRPLAEALKKIEGGCHVLVQAVDWYDRRRDDRVNKLAGRYALAAEADANVQYLRPRAPGQRGFANYLHRVQAAIYDLVFGHSGYVADIGPVLEGAFPDPDSRPTAVVGISVLGQARTRIGGSAGRFCIATRIDPTSNRTLARVGWHDAEMRWSADWEPLFNALKRVASPEVAFSLGEGVTAERANFQLFVAGIFDDCAESGERPLVLIDSASASGLWPWLADARIGQEITIGAERLDPSRRWPMARIVRIRLGHAARIAERKSVLYQEVDPDTGADRGERLDRYCPTITARTVRLAANGVSAHYWTTGGYFQMSLPRGLSVYRPFASFAPVAKLDPDRILPAGHDRLLTPIESEISDVSYRLPNPIETTVAHLCDGDDPDRIAHLVASLREGYGHTAAATALPAPLSFESKVRDYMTRFGLDEAEQEEETTPEEGAGPSNGASEVNDEAEGDVPAEAETEQPGLVATDPRAWTNLIERKGITFMGSTSLSTSGLAPSGPSGGDFLASGPAPRDPSVQEQDDTLSALKGEPTSREPIIPVPEFITPEWIRSEVQIPNAQIRAMHEAREEIRKSSGFAGWPEAKPDWDGLAELLPEAMRYPRFLNAIIQAAQRKMPAHKARFWYPFARLWRKARQMAGERSRSATQREIAELLVGSGQLELAFAYIVLLSYTFKAPDDLHDLVETDPRFTPIQEFMRSTRRELFRDDYYESGDVSEQDPDDETSQVAVALDEATDLALVDPSPDASDAGDEAVSTLAGQPEPPAGLVDSDVGPDRTPEQDWAASLARIAGIAASNPEPDNLIVERLTLALAQAEEALERFEAARPRLVDASDLAAAIVEALNRVSAILAEAGQPEQITAADPVPSAPMLAADQAEQLQSEVAQIGEALERARTRLDEALEIMAKQIIARLEEALALRTDAVGEAHESARRLHTIIGRLLEGSSNRPDRQPDAANRLEVVRAADLDVREHSGPITAASEHGTSAEATEAEPVDFSDARDADWDGELDPVEAEAILAELNDPTEPASEVYAQVSTPADPMRLKILARFLDLVEHRNFALAYHLQQAALACGLTDELPISQAELRLAAISGKINHGAHQGAQFLHELLAGVHLALESIEDDAPFSEVRRIIALGAITPLALYQVDPEARSGLEAVRHVADGLGEAVHKLREAIAASFAMGLSLSPALMRMAGEEAEETRYGQEVTQRLLGELREFAKKTYKFQLGLKLRNVLSKRDGELGRLEERIEKGGAKALDAARDFVAAYSERGAILHLLEDAEKRTGNYKMTGIDGIARERMVGAIQTISALAAEYVETRTAAPTLLGTRQNIQKARSGIVSSATAVIEALGALPVADPLTASAVHFATSSLQTFLGSVRGDAPVASASDHLFALYGPLIWIPAFEFGHSWLPAPYLPDQVVGVLLDHRNPDPGDAASLAAAAAARIESGSHIAAAMLIEAAPYYGLAQATAVDLSGRRELDAQTRRDALAIDLRDARLMVDRLQRMGGGAGHDEAQSLMSLLNRIVPDELPVIIASEARSETAEGQQILDFPACYDLIRDVRAKVAHLLQRPRDALLAKIDRLAGTAAEEDLAKVRALVSRDDLLTAGEYVDFLENGRALPETTSPNPRFRAYFPHVPDAVTALPRAAREKIGDSIRAGSDVGPLLYSRIPADRRPEAADMLDKWHELKRAVDSGVPEADVVGRLAFLLGGFGIEAEIRGSAPRGNRRIYAVDLRFDLPLDSESVLLPDFGSLTGGDYRVCVTAKVPTEAELRAIRRDAGALRLVLFVTETVTSARRKQLLLSCLENMTRLLVIDDAIMLYAFSEPELRGQTLFECAQPFSFAEPYHDYGNAAVPREMFFGRAVEQRKLLEPHGSCIVYGGRRLGKTALLRHIQAEHNDPAAGTAIAYVSILDLGANAREEQIWEYMSRELTAIFDRPVESEERFSAAVRNWLAIDSKRRVQVLLDESDRFIQADADKGFAQFVRMQRLMDDTNRRFKFVLAGLHNVTRLVHTENPPLKQIASDPQRIGPLMDEELGDAEALVVRPLAGMGFEFDSREDVWRILSYCNYYPVLVQKFCQQLVQQLATESLRRRRPLTQITSEHVRQALDNEVIAREIGETFDYTISKIEDRYALMANIVADRAIHDAAEGKIGEGMSSVEVRDAAASWWPAAFREANRLAVVEDLLDEMEGLGVLRRTPGGRWALRSPAILRLLGDDNKIAAKLGEFLDRDAPPVFDPRSMRRTLKGNPRMKVNEGDVSPLTWGQEHDILRDKTPVSIVFGNQLSGIELVSGALTSIKPSHPGPSATVSARSWPSLEAFRKEVRSPPGDGIILHVVDQSTAWDSDWIVEGGRAKPVRDGRARVLFVGGAQHALDWINDPRANTLSQGLKVIPLQTWSATLIDHKLQQEHLDPDKCRPALRNATGGFNRPMQEAFAGPPAATKAFVSRLETARARRLADAALAAELGLVGPMFDLFSRIADYAGSADVTAYEIGEGPIVETGMDLTGLRAVEFGVLLSILEAQAGSASDGKDSRPYRLNPLLLAALTGGKVR